MIANPQSSRSGRVPGLYGEPELPRLPEAPDGGTLIMVAETDPRLARYGRVTPFASVDLSMVREPLLRSASTRS